jgi:3-hydroxy-9,10-secoandrosta-1,3,5(10)-triene-9,17-dione monooxygenase reductase component
MADLDDDLRQTAAPSIDSAHYRSVVGHFATGIAIVTAVDGSDPVGLTCVSFVPLSLDPPLVMFSPQKTSSSYPRIKSAGSFCVNILTDEQEDVCRVFAQSGGDKFRGIGWRPGPSGSPILHDVLAWVDCRIETEHDAGDHLIVVGRVLELQAAREGKPLLFHRGGYGSFEG